MNTELKKYHKKYFGTDGIRGKANQYPITPDFAVRLGQAMSKFFCPSNHQGHDILVGCDARISGEPLKLAIASGLIAGGVNVRILPCLTSPALAIYTRLYHARGSVMITASHNPPEDNGFKFFNDQGLKPSDDWELQVEQFIDHNANLQWPSWESTGRVIYEINTQKYQEWVIDTLHHAHHMRGKKCVFDCANGSATFIAPFVMEKLGIEPYWVGNHPNGVNTGVDCGALYPEQAKQAVLQQNVPIGFAVDGDGDRLVVIDENGQLVPGDIVIALLAEILDRKKELPEKGIVLTQMSNMGVIQYLQQRDYRIMITDVGDKYVAEEMRNQGWMLGGEESGHIILGKYAPGGDGLLVALHLWQGILEYGISLSKFVSDIPLYARKTLSIPIKEKIPLEECKNLMSMEQKLQAEYKEDIRTLLRYSGTEAKLRILVESSKPEIIQKAIHLLEKAAKKDLYVCV